MAYIFAEPKKAMELFVQRMFQERINPAVDRYGGCCVWGGGGGRGSSACLGSASIRRWTGRAYQIWAGGGKGAGSAARVRGASIEPVMADGPPDGRPEPIRGI